VKVHAERAGLDGSAVHCSITGYDAPAPVALASVW